jgi:multiple sugar transport system substrate-binding protein
MFNIVEIFNNYVQGEERMSKVHKLLVLGLLLAFVLTACNGENVMTEKPPEPTEAPMVKTEEPTEPPPPMVDPTGQTVLFWAENGQVTRERGEEMIALIDEFNANNEWGITVEWVNQGGYEDIENAMNAAIQSGDLPNVVTAYTGATHSWYLLDVVTDLNPFINDPNYGLTAAELDAVYDAPLSGGQTADGVQFAWAVSQSGDVMVYNKTWAAELGYDSPPTTFAEIQEMSCAAHDANAADDDPDNDGTGGYHLYLNTQVPLAFLWASGGTVLNDAGDGYNINTPEMLAVGEHLKGLKDSGCYITTDSYPNPEFATRQAMFISTSSAGLKYVVGAFTDIGSTDEVEFFPYPGKDGGGAADAYIQYESVIKNTPEADLASWLFIRYLTAPEQQARWVIASKYFPTQSTTEPLVAEFSAEDAHWATLKGIISDYGVAEPSLPSWQAVRSETRSTFEAIVQAEDTAAITALLEALDDAAVEAVEDTQ